MRHWRIILSYSLLIGWMVVIFFLSSEGNAASTGRSDAIVELFRTMGVAGQADWLTFMVRKSAHVIAYLILGMLAYSALRLHVRTPRVLLALSSSLVVLYAVSDEIHQLFTPGRSGEIRDVLIDSVAGMVGILLIHFYWIARTSRAMTKGQGVGNDTP
jgi:VanZ family protein